MRRSVHVLCLGIVMLLSVTNSFGQRKRSELALGYGYYSIYSLVNHGMNDAPFNTSSGTWSFTYRYYLSRTVTLGLGLGMENLTTWANFVTVAPEVTVCYLDTRHDYVRVRLYGAASYGISVLNDNDIPKGSADESGAKPWAFQATPFGMRVGRQFAGFIEVGMGYKGLVHGGIEFRWPQILAQKHHEE